MQIELRREGASTEEAAAKADVKVLYFRSLFESQEVDGKLILPSAEQPVQLTMLAS